MKNIRKIKDHKDAIVPILNRHDYRIFCSVTNFALFIVSIISLSLYGMGQRGYAPEDKTYSVNSPEEAYNVLETNNVKGRVLLLFGKYPHIRKSLDHGAVRELGPSNFIEFAAFNNRIRRIYYIIRDEDWEALRQKGITGAFRDVPGMERGVYLFNLIGIPITATTPYSLPQIREKVIVSINTGLFDDSYVRELLSAKSISPDIILIYHGI